MSKRLSDNMRDTDKAVDMIICNDAMARCMFKLNRTENLITTTIPSTAKMDQLVVGDMPAPAFRGPDGKDIPITITRWVPNNCIMALHTPDLDLYGTDLDFMRLTGKPWQQKMGTREATFEAPMHAYQQLGARACDGHVLFTDLKDNIG